MKKLLFLTSLVLTLSSCQQLHKTNNQSEEQCITTENNPWLYYFNTTINKSPNEFINIGSKILKDEKKDPLIVIDLGAGTGVNIDGLLKDKAIVYAYDASPKSIEILQDRFQNFITNKQLFIYQKYFEEILILPKSNLIIAWHTLPFMKKKDLHRFWKKITQSLVNDGLFIGTFFGKKHYLKRSPNRPPFIRMKRSKVLKLFKNFHILYFHEEKNFDSESSKAHKTKQYQHLYKIIARKKAL